MAVFRFKAPQSGRYQILLAYSAHETRAKNVPLTVSSGTEKTTLVVDQTKALPQGKQFRPLGIVDLEGNTETTITMTNDKTNGFVILDALQLLPVK